MGSERASSVRQRYAGKVCCECGRSLPPPHRRGERLCQECAGVGRRRVFLRFKFLHGWHCEFFDETLKTALPRTVLLPDEKKLFEMLKRGGYTLNIAGRREIEDAIRQKKGGVWLDLTAEQYAKLRDPNPNPQQSGSIMSQFTFDTDGGPAFPISISGVGDNGGGGMSMRDWFASQAISQVLSLSQQRDGSWDPVAVSSGCYAIADAMLLERKTQQQNHSRGDVESRTELVVSTEA